MLSKKTVLIFLGFFMLLFWSSCPVCAASPPLPPEAQQAIKKGLLAAEQQDWQLAIRYFEEARKTAPQAPEVFFNLGLAESKIPGRELRSIAWFKAYLAADPQAANAQTVRDTVEKLEIRVEGTMGKLLGQARQLAGQFPDEGYRNAAYSLIAEAMIKTGDVNGAAQMMAAIPNFRGDIWKTIAEAFAKAGDVAGAKAIAYSLDSTNDKSVCFQKIAVAQAESGDITGARATLQTSTWPPSRTAGMIGIAKALHRQGRKDEAYQTLENAAQMVKLDPGPNFNSSYSVQQQTEWALNGRVEQYVDLGRAQAELGDIRGALRTADLIPQHGRVSDVNARGDITGSTVSSLYGDRYRGSIYSTIVTSNYGWDWTVSNPSYDSNLLQEVLSRLKDQSQISQLQGLLGKQLLKTVQDKLSTADPKGAESVANSIPDQSYKAKAYEKITQYFVYHGDLESARAQVDSVPDANIRGRLCLSLAGKYRRGGDERKMREMISKARTAAKEKSDDYTLRDIASKQAEIGDLDGARETVLTIQGESAKGGAYRSIAREQLKGKDLSGAKRTASLISGGSDRDSLLGDIAKIEAVSGLVDEAKQTASTISGESYKNGALRNIAYTQAHFGDIKGALNTLSLINSDSFRLTGYRWVAGAAEDAGYMQIAREVVARAEAVAAGMNDPVVRREALCELAGDTVIYDLHLPAEGRVLLESARSAAAQIGDPEKRSDAYAGSSAALSGRMQYAGLFLPARETFWSAMDSAQQINVIGSRDYRFSSLAKIQAERGDFAGAQKTADLIRSRDKWDGAMGAIASSWLKFGKIKEAEEIARRVQAKGEKERIRLEIIRVLADQGNIETAKQQAPTLAEQGKRDAAIEAIAIALLKTGDLSGAEAAAAQLQGNPGDKLLDEMTKAGGVDWALNAIVTPRRSNNWDPAVDALGTWSPSDDDSSFRYIAVAQARSGNLEGAKKTSRLISKNSYYMVNVYVAVAKAGDTAWALEAVADFRDPEYRPYALKEIAAALVEGGGMAGARRALEMFKKERLSTRQAKEVSRVLVKMGDLAGALATLASIHPRDAEFESWAGYEIAMGQPEPQWKATAAGIKDSYWRSRLFAEKAKTMEDAAAAQEAATAIPDALEKSIIRLELVRKALKARNLSQALTLSELIPDEECRLLALSETAFLSINSGGVAGVIPKIRALPDTAGKAFILLDVAAALTAAGDYKTATPLLAAAVASAGKMTDGYWKARTLGEISKVAASARESTLSKQASSLAEVVAGKMQEEDRKSWANYLSQPQFLDLDQIEVEEVKAKRSEKWVKLIDSDLNKPLFTDIQGHVQSLSAKPTPWDIFSGFTGTVDNMANTLKKIEQVESGK